VGGARVGADVPDPEVADADAPAAGDPGADDAVVEFVGGTKGTGNFAALDGAEWADGAEAAAAPDVAVPGLLEAADLTPEDAAPAAAEEDEADDAPCPPPATTAIAAIAATPAAIAPVACQTPDQRRPLCGPPAPNRRAFPSSGANRRSTF